MKPRIPRRSLQSGSGPKTTAPRTPESVFKAIVDATCHACSKPFSKTLTLADYEEGEVACPDRGSIEVEQRLSSGYKVTSKKSA